MKKLFFYIIFFPQLFFAQKVFISTPVNNLLYLEVSNSVEINVEGFDCKDLRVQVNDGTVEGNGCNLIIKPNKTGLLQINIFNRKNKLIAEKTINVVNLEFVARLKAPVDENNKIIIERATGIFVEVRQVPLDFDYSKIEYTLMIIRENDVIFKNSYTGNFFDDVLKNELKKITKNDLIIITDIQFLSDGKAHQLNDIVIKKGGNVP